MPRVAHHQHPLEAEHQPVEHHADQRDQDHRHEHRGGVERDLHLQHQVAETAVGAEELADDGAGDRQDGGDLHAGEDVGQRAGKLDLGEDLPARALERAHEVEEVGLDLAQPARGGEHDRKEADRERHHRVRADAVAEPDDDQRAERDLGDHVEAHQQRHHRHLEQAEPGEQQRSADADDDGERVAGENLGRRHRDVLQPAVVRHEQRQDGVVGRRHHELRHLAEHDEEMPRRHQREMARHRQRVALQLTSGQRASPPVLGHIANRVLGLLPLPVLHGRAG